MKFSDLELNFKQPEEFHTKPDVDLLVSGEKFTDHMLRVPWDLDKGWGKPLITALKDLELHPAAKVFHYAIEVLSSLRVGNSFLKLTDLRFLKASELIVESMNTSGCSVPTSTSNACWIRPTSSPYPGLMQVNSSNAWSNSLRSRRIGCLALSHPAFLPRPPS